MQTMRRIEEIKSTLEDGEEGTAEIRAAARALEVAVDAREVLAAVADPDFPSVLLVAAEDCSPEVERAWLTLAAAGARRTRQVLAWRASQLVDASQLAAVAMRRGRARKRDLQRLVAVSDQTPSAAWALLAHLRGSELRAMVKARPSLAAAHDRARAERGPVPVRAARPVMS